MREQIENNSMLKNPEILEDVNANAKAYALCLGA